jgi:hypothetical protein
MAFPTTSVLDAFTRANGALGASWTNGFYGDGSNLQVNSNQLANSAAGYSSAEYNTAYGPDVELYLTLPTMDTAAFYFLSVRKGGTLGSPTGYYLEINQFGNKLVRMDGGGTETPLGANFTQAVASGDSVGLSVVGSTITAYYKAAAGSWTIIATRTDSTYTGTGLLSIDYNSTTARLDDFGGGTVVTGGGTTFNLKGDMRGRGNEQLTPKLNKTFTGNLDGYGKDKLTPGKTYNGITGNLDAYGKEQLTPGKGFGITGNMEGYGKESFTENKNVSFSGQLDGYGKDNFVENKTSQLSANMEGYGKENVIPGKSYSFSGNLDGKAGEKLTPWAWSFIRYAATDKRCPVFVKR